MIFNTIVSSIIILLIFTFLAFFVLSLPIYYQSHHVIYTLSFILIMSTICVRKLDITMFDIYIDKFIPLSTLFSISSWHVILFCQFLSDCTPFCNFLYFKHLSYKPVFLLSPWFFLRHFFIYMIFLFS